mgnify:CR=1 FL=1
MSRAVFIAGGSAAIAIAAGVAVYLKSASAPDTVLSQNWAMLDKYCVNCHNDAERTGDISFEHAKLENVVQDARLWEAALKKLRLGMMPPRDEPQSSSWSPPSEQPSGEPCACPPSSSSPTQT